MKTLILFTGGFLLIWLSYLAGQDDGRIMVRQHQREAAAEAAAIGYSQGEIDAVSALIKPPHAEQKPHSELLTKQARILAELYQITPETNPNDIWGIK